MSTRIVVEFEANNMKKSVEVRRSLEGDHPHAAEKKLMVHYLVAIGRGLALMGIEQQNPTLLSEASAFVGMARDVYEHSTEEERKA